VTKEATEGSPQAPIQPWQCVGPSHCRRQTAWQACELLGAQEQPKPVGCVLPAWCPLLLSCSTSVTMSGVPPSQRCAHTSGAFPSGARLSLGYTHPTTAQGDHKQDHQSYNVVHARHYSRILSSPFAGILIRISEPRRRQQDIRRAFVGRPLEQANHTRTGQHTWPSDILRGVDKGDVRKGLREVPTSRLDETSYSSDKRPTSLRRVSKRLIGARPLPFVPSRRNASANQEQARKAPSPWARPVSTSAGS
jgi:hypothetical protein